MADQHESSKNVKLREPEPPATEPGRAADRGSDRRLRPLYPDDIKARRLDRRRGRDAGAPSSIPARGWKDILLRVYRGVSDDRVLANAAAVTFYALLAVSPGIAALVSIYTLFADPQSIAQHLDALSGVLPGGAIDVVRDQLDRLVAQPRGKLGLSLLIGLVASLWSANGGVKALFDALNVIYEEREERSFIRLNAVSLTFTAAMIAFLIAALACLVALPAALTVLPGFVGVILSYARWPALLVLVTIALACIFRYGPDRTEPRWRWVSWGSGFGAVGWLVVSALFSWYAANFGNFNKTYGSLGAVIGFMMWIWLSVTVILIGAKINAETEHQTARDTTEGPEKPLGTREAKMADTVGPPESSAR
jgi:membrane protein